MARKIDDINDSIIASKEAQAELSVLDNTSKTSIWRLWAYITSVNIWTLETNFDNHKTEVTNIIESTKVGYIPFLRDAILNFQYGYDLVKDEIYYDNTGLSDDLIAASKVVKYVAIVELTRGLLIKVAGDDGTGGRAPITSDQQASLEAYIGRIKPPGVGIKVVNKIADRLRLQLRIYYNPLILDSTGKRIDGTNDTPVQDATNTFLENQPFNGQYIITRHEAALSAVDGVVIPRIIVAAAAYESVPFQPFDALYLPDSGYLKFADPIDFTIEFVPHENL